MPIWRYSICNNTTWSSTESSDPLHKSIRNPRSRLAWLVPLWKRSLIARLTESINLRAEINLGVSDALELEISHKITLLLPDERFSQRKTTFLIVLYTATGIAFTTDRLATREFR